MLTHDPKFDVPVLEIALRLPEVGYVGAMGSRRTHEDRMARLREAGLTEAELARLSSPVGLDLGARTPEETAVSIAAEIIALQWGGRGERLGHREGPIHHHAPGLVARGDGTRGGHAETTRIDRCHRPAQRRSIRRCRACPASQRSAAFRHREVIE